MVKKLFRWLLASLFRVKLLGLENYALAGDRVLIIANHTSYLDPLLLWAFLPDEVTFAINTAISEQWWVKPALKFAKVFPMDPLQPLSLKALTHYLKEDRKAVIFPEGRITVTGAMMAPRSSQKNQEQLFSRLELMAPNTHLSQDCMVL